MREVVVRVFLFEDLDEFPRACAVEGVARYALWKREVSENLDELFERLFTEEVGEELANCASLCADLDKWNIPVIVCILRTKKPSELATLRQISEYGEEDSFSSVPIELRCGERGIFGATNENERFHEHVSIWLSKVIDRIRARLLKVVQFERSEEGVSGFCKKHDIVFTRQGRIFDKKEFE